MNDLFDEMIQGLLERGKIGAMIDLPAQVFDRLLEAIQRKRQERPDFCRDLSDPGSIDTPEG